MQCKLKQYKKYNNPISIGLLSTILLSVGVTKQAHAATINDYDIIDNWTTNIEPAGIRALYPDNPHTKGYANPGQWAVDATFNTVGYRAITNRPRKIDVDSNLLRTSGSTGSLISDFSTSTDFKFSTRLYFPNDDDAAGLLWGYQDLDNHYRLSWDSGGDVDLKGEPHVPYEGFEAGRGLHVVKEVDGIKTVLATQQRLYWDHGTTYNVTVIRRDDQFKLRIRDEFKNRVFSTTVVDDSFLTGQIGLFSAGVEVLYSRVQLKDFGSNTNSLVANTVADNNVQDVPEPLTILGTITAFGCGALFKKKRQNNLDANDNS